MANEGDTRNYGDRVREAPCYVFSETTKQWSIEVYRNGQWWLQWKCGKLHG